MILAYNNHSGGCWTHTDFLLTKLFSLSLLFLISYLSLISLSLSSFLRSGAGIGVHTAWLQPPGEKKKTKGNIVMGFGEWVMGVFGSLLFSLSHPSALSRKATVRINVCYCNRMKTRVAYAQRGIRFCLTDKSKSRHAVQGWEAPGSHQGYQLLQPRFFSVPHSFCLIGWDGCFSSRHHAWVPDSRKMRRRCLWRWAGIRHTSSLFDPVSHMVVPRGKELWEM